MKQELRYVLFAITLPLIGACGASPSENLGEEEAFLRATYADVAETLEGKDLDRWFAVSASLREGFERTCDGALCNGAYGRLASVRLACSSTRLAHKMKDCVWVLGASLEYVDAADGTMTNDTRVWTCHVPVTGFAKVMLDVLEAAGENAFRTPLPGTSRSFEDALSSCVRGATPNPAPDETLGTFTDLGDRRRAGGAHWTVTKRRLNERFEDVCGDSFCEGDYSDIAGLGLSCAVEQTTDRVAKCTWSFAAADTAVDSRGHLTAGTKLMTCPIAIDASAAELTLALAVDDPLQAQLPGQNTSFYDALVGCL